MGGDRNQVQVGGAGAIFGYVPALNEGLLIMSVH